MYTYVEQHRVGEGINATDPNGVRVIFSVPELEQGKWLS